jgi:hypothetical protein
VKSLADHLGVSVRPDEIHPQEPSDEELLSMSVRDFARGILRSRDYRRSIIHRVTLGNLPPAVEVLLYHYAEGKPVDKIEVTTPEMEQLTSEQLEARAMQLAVLARDLRAREEAPAEPASEPSPAGVAVH